MNESLFSSRIAWIDISRGIGIIIVILVHSMIPMINAVTIHLSSFAIALFFILAGFTYNAEKHRSRLYSFFKVRVRQLLIPYFCLYVVMIVLFAFLAPFVDTYLTPSDVVFWFLYGAGPPDQATHLWFLPVLFFGLCFFAIIELATQSLHPSIRWGLVVILPLLGMGIRTALSPTLVPWHLSSVLMATAFCIIGHELKRARGMGDWHSQSTIKNALALLFLLSLLLISSALNGFVDLAVDRLGNHALLYMVSGTAGSTLVFFISSIINNKKMSDFFSRLGRESQVVYEIHPIFFYLIPISLFIISWSPDAIAASFNLFWPARFIAGFILSIHFAYALVPRSRVLRILFTGRT